MFLRLFLVIEAQGGRCSCDTPNHACPSEWSRWSVATYAPQTPRGHASNTVLHAFCWCLKQTNYGDRMWLSSALQRILINFGCLATVLLLLRSYGGSHRHDLRRVEFSNAWPESEDIVAQSKRQYGKTARTRMRRRRQRRRRQRGTVCAHEVTVACSFEGFRQFSQPAGATAGKTG